MSLKRIRKSILKRAASFIYPNGYYISKRNNLLWLLNHNNFVDRQFDVFGDFESLQIKYLFSAHDGIADTFLDIGSNFGLYTLNAAALGIAKEFIAFEPDPRNVAQLNGNLYLNGMAQFVTVHPKAVSERSGQVGMVLHPSVSTGTTRVAQAGDSSVEVPCVSLDDEFRWLNRNIIMKIDIEGHEISALRGMTDLLTNNQCILQVEVFEENRLSVNSFMNFVGYCLFNQIESDFYYRKKGAMNAGTHN